MAFARWIFIVFAMTFGFSTVIAAAVVIYWLGGASVVRGYAQATPALPR